MRFRRCRIPDPTSLVWVAVRTGVCGTCQRATEVHAVAGHLVWAAHEDMVLHDLCRESGVPLCEATPAGGHITGLTRNLIVLAPGCGGQHPTTQLRKTTNRHRKDWRPLRP